jgi:hypothetical protein
MLQMGHQNTLETTSHHNVACSASVDTIAMFIKTFIEGSFFTVTGAVIARSALPNESPIMALGQRIQRAQVR